MNKGIQTMLGFIIFLLMAFPVIGSIIGNGEADAFNVAKVEHLQRVRETGHDSDSVRSYEEHMKQRFEDYKITIDKVGDEGGDISYGDEVEVTISASGSGLFNFKKSKRQLEKEGLDEGDNLPKFTATERIIIDRRDE